MKKTYETPEAEKMDFCYRDQVVAASLDTEKCDAVWINSDTLDNPGYCVEGNTPIKWLN